MALQFTAEQRAAYRAAYAPGATNELFDLFIVECERRELIPGKDVIFQTRTSNEYNQQLNRTVSVTKPALITTIGALRLIAARTGQMDGYGKFQWWYGKKDGMEGFESFDIPQGRIPHAVTVEIYRKDWRHPVSAVARYDAYVQKKQNGDPNSVWEKRGEEQLAKCAEALGLKMLAPEEAGGLLISEEIANQETALEQLKDAAGVDVHCVPSTALVEEVVVPKPTVAPAVNQAPAVMQAPVVAAGDATSVNPPVPVQPVAAKPVAAPAKPAAPAAPPKPNLPAAPPRASAPVHAPAPAPVHAPVIPNRVPQVDAPQHESIREINAVADAVARDKDPVPVAPVAAPAAPIAPVIPEGMASREELAAFKNRAGKLMRDKLEKEGGMKSTDASTGLRNYILKQGGATAMEKILKTKWEEILTTLEKVTAAEAAILVKENK